MKGRAKDGQHRVVTGEQAESTLDRVIMEYCFLQEGMQSKKDEAEETTKAKSSLTALVMVEPKCPSIWAYAVESKGASEEWAVEQLLDDLESVGGGTGKNNNQNRRGTFHN